MFIAFRSAFNFTIFLSKIADVNVVNGTTLIDLLDLFVCYLVSLFRISIMSIIMFILKHAENL